MMGSFITDFHSIWVSSILSLERQFWTRCFLPTGLEPLWITLGNASETYKVNIPAGPYHALEHGCAYLAQLYDLFPKHSSSQQRMESILRQVLCPEVGGREGWVGDTLTDADKHRSLKLCGQSVWFLSLPLPTEVCRNCFLGYYSKDVSF